MRIRKRTLLLIVLSFLIVVPAARALQSRVAASRGDTMQTIHSGNRQRLFMLHLPQGYDRKKRYPLVFVFHGGTGGPKQVMEQTGFNAEADKKGFIVAYPAGFEKNWNDGRGTTEPEKEGIDDVAFVRDLLSHIQKKYSVDSDRIYATGISNGGIFSHRLGCEMGDVFAAIAPVVGAMASNIVEACAPQDPLSVLMIMSTADNYVLYDGGESGKGDGGKIESAEDSLSFWVEKNRCPREPEKSSLPTRVKDGTSVDLYRYAPCAEGTETLFYKVINGGHQWPPSIIGGRIFSRVMGLGISSRNIDATKTIAEFFERHEKGE